MNSVLIPKTLIV